MPDTSAESARIRPFDRQRQVAVLASQRFGGSGAPPIASALGVAADIADHLVDRLGSEALGVATGCRPTPGGTEPLVPGLPYLRGEALHAVRNEMACSLTDVLCRRTRAAILDRDATLPAASDVAGLIATDLGWSRSRQLDETAAPNPAALERSAEGADAVLSHLGGWSKTMAGVAVLVRSDEARGLAACRSRRGARAAGRAGAWRPGLRGRGRWDRRRQVAPRR